MLPLFCKPSNLLVTYYTKNIKEEVNHIKEQIKYQESQGIVTRSQFVTLYGDNAKGKNIKYNPYAFTE